MLIEKREIKIKNDETIILKLKYNELDNYYIINATNSEKKKVAFLTFSLKSGTCFLNNIKIENSKYSRLGIGSQMLELMEDTAISKRNFRVDGKFFPYGNLGQYARAFYKKHGYEIYKDDYETYIGKRLKEKTIEYTA